MLSRLLRRFAAAVAAIGAVLFIGGNRAEAALEFELTSSGPAQFFYASSSNSGVVTINTPVDNYSGQVETTLTNSPGSSTLGVISTTLNLTLVNTNGPSSTLTVTVMVINQIGALDTTPNGGTTAISVTAGQLSGSTLKPWTAPSGTHLVATANTSTSSSVVSTGGTAATTTYVDSPPLAGSPAVPGTMVVTSGSLSLPNPQASVLMSAPVTSTGTYSFSQSVTVTGLTTVAGPPNPAVNITGTSTVAGVVPEPSSMALAGLGALGFIGYGLRRRKASGT
jgi:hypothetical protein